MTSERPHLLIVDDEPLNRDLLRRVLQSTYDLSEAGDATEALEVLEGDEGPLVKLILCDYLMPGRTGAELAGIVNDRWPGIPFMLLTGYDGDEAIVEAQEAGLVEQVVSKPWRSKELRAVIAERLGPKDPA